MTDLLFFFRRPTTNPTTRAIITTTIKSPMMRIRSHPPLLAMYLLFLTSPSFSPFGPVASQTLYLGGGVSKLCRGGSPIFHRRLKNRLCVLSGSGGGIAPSSSMIDNLVSTELPRLRRLRLPTFLEWTGGGAERSTKLDEPTNDMVLSDVRVVFFRGLGGFGGGVSSSIDEWEARSRRLS